MELCSNNHSVFALHYHLVLVVKNRRQAITDNISIRLKEIFENIQGNYNIICDEWNYDKDHVHVLFRAEPNSEISKFINAYKSDSSRLIKRSFRNKRKALEGIFLEQELLFIDYWRSNH